MEDMEKIILDYVVEENLEDDDEEIEETPSVPDVDHRFTKRQEILRILTRDMEMLLGLPNLQQLTLARCRFSEPAFALLKNMTSLRQLDLSDTIVGNAEVRQLAAFAWPPT